MSAQETKPLVLFGGESGWHESDWTSSDDRVRSGKSQSYLDCSASVGHFHGTLDIKTLGGAGFASQRTTGDDREWDLSAYKGLLISVVEGDKRRYTFNLKDELLPKDPKTGREQSTVTYECDFELPPQSEPGKTKDRKLFIPWASFNATYRGRLKDDAKPLNLKKIKRVSIMIRSFFGSQEGDFSLTLRSITALASVPEVDQAAVAAVEPSSLEKSDGIAAVPTTASGQARGGGTIIWLIRAAVTLFLIYKCFYHQSEYFTQRESPN